MNQLTKFQRLDRQLTDRGLVATPQRAQELILNGAVRVNGAVITAPHCPVDKAHNIEISGIDCPWVSPDALKLFEALEAAKIDVKGRIAVDIGAGIGGFEDVILQKGGKKIYAIEKEAALLHHSLSLNPRIKNLQRIEAKDVNASHLDDGKFDLIVTDIGTENLAEHLKPVLSLAQSGYDLLVFGSDKKELKEQEKILRLEFGLLVKKAPDKYQKEWEEKGSFLIWLQKRA